jgi:hypothetical protein
MIKKASGLGEKRVKVSASRYAIVDNIVALVTVGLWKLGEFFLS